MRESAKYVKQNLVGPINIAEIGVGSGDNALDMLSNIDVSMIYLVDPYIEYCDHDSCTPEDAKEKTQEQQDATYTEMTLKIEQFASKTTIVKKASVEAAADYANGFFDYVYIDGCLSTASVANDIAAWWQKVKTGGVIAGHDYNFYPGVKTSVDAFVAANGLSLNLSNAEGGSDWYIIK